MTPFLPLFFRIIFISFLTLFVLLIILKLRFRRLQWVVAFRYLNLGGWWAVIRALLRLRLMTGLRHIKDMTLVSVVTLISILGITVGVTALIVTLALMTGFQEKVHSTILNSNAHLTIAQLGGDGVIENHTLLSEHLLQRSDITAVSPIILDKGMLISQYNESGVIVRGVILDQELQVTTTLQHVVEGDVRALQEKESGIVLGREVANMLGAVVGDEIRLVSADLSLAPFSAYPKNRLFEVVGIFHSGMYQYDATWAFINFEAAQSFFGVPHGASMIEIRASDYRLARKIKKELLEELDDDFFIHDLYEMNKQLFAAFKLEKLGMSILTGLIVVVAAFGITATLIMMVMEKNRDIGILVSMGATSKDILGIFILQGLIIGVLGTSFGCVLGFTTCWFLDHYQLIELSEELYLISYVPFKIKIFDFSLISSLAIVISFLATLFPAWKAARLDPVKAIRYE